MVDYGCGSTIHIVTPEPQKHHVQDNEVVACHCHAGNGKEISSSFLDSNRADVLLGDLTYNYLLDYCKSSSDHIFSTYFLFQFS